MIIVSFYLTERFGRRTLLLIGASGCFVCNIIIGTLGVVARTETVLHATLAVICIWVLFYSGCMAGVSWGLTTEIATPRLRARTAAVVINGSQCFSLMFGYTVLYSFFVSKTLLTPPGAPHALCHRIRRQELGCEDVIPLRLSWWYRLSHQLVHAARSQYTFGAAPCRSLIQRLRAVPMRSSTRCSKPAFPQGR